MKKENNNKNDESSLKYEYIARSISSLSNEVKDKKDEIEIIKNQIKKHKNEYSQGLQQYITLNNNIIATETELEKYYKCKNKIKRQYTLILSSFDKKIVSRIRDYTNIPDDDLCNLLLTFFGFNYSITYPFLLQITKTVEDWKELFKISINKNYTIEDISIISDLMKKIKQKPNYPYDILIEIIGQKIKECDINIKINNLLNEIEEIQLNKNKIFLSLKTIEMLILQNHSIYKGMVKYIKGIYNLFEKFNKFKSFNDSNQNDDDTTKIKQNLIEDLTASIKTFKKINFKEIYTPFDNVTSLTIRSEFSDELSSISLSTDKMQTSYSFYKNNHQNNSSNQTYLENSKNNSILRDKKENKENKKSELADNKKEETTIPLSTKKFCKYKNLSKPITSKSAAKPKSSSYFKQDENDEIEYLNSEENQLIINNNPFTHNFPFTKIEFSKISNNDIYLNTNNTFEIQEYNANSKGNINYISPMNAINIKPSKFFEENPIKINPTIKPQTKKNHVIQYENTVDIDKCCTACT